MRVALLSSALSIHTIRWANTLSEIGIEVHVISQHPPLEVINENVKVHLLPSRGVLGYFTMVPAVKKILKKIKPDILNAHYASGYGTTARLVNFHPWLLSVWGSDVYDFPYKSPLHMQLIRKNLHSADAIASTSICMAKQVNNITSGLKKVSITPFGINTNVFKPSMNHNLEKKRIVIGTVKSLTHTYGVDILIKSFAILLQTLTKERYQTAKELELHIVGTGPDENNLRQLAIELGIHDKVLFIGQVDNSQVPKELEKFDIYVALSRSESFGVAIIEASSTGLPVIVSNVGGLPEVVIDGITGIIVPPENPEAASKALLKLSLEPNLRMKMGEAGRQYIIDKYDWDISVDIMKRLYQKTIEDYKKSVL